MREGKILDLSYLELVNPDKSMDKGKAGKKLDQNKEKSEAVIISKKINDIISLDKFFEMLKWYESKKHKEDLAANSLSQIIDINEYESELQGDVSVKYLIFIKDIKSLMRSILK